MTPALKAAPGRRAKKLPRQLVEFDPNTPAHVRHCYGTGSRDWWIYTWDRDSPAVKHRVPYQCRSWRCTACRQHEAHVLYARIQEAFEGLDPDGFCFLVLTIDRDGYYSGKRWPDARTAFAELSKLTGKFLKRLWRHAWKQWPAEMAELADKLPARAWDDTPADKRINRQWVGTVESHRSGWPHMNLIVHCPPLARHLREVVDGRIDDGMYHVDARLLHGELARHAQAAGWGVMSTGEAAKSRDRAAGYVVKVAGMAERTVGEVAKLTQLPLEAPQRFRRLRSGKGFLPPRRKNPAYTGTLLRRRVDHDGTVVVVPLHQTPAELLDHVRGCCSHEENLADQEHAEAAWNRHAARYAPGLLVSPPAVQSFACGRSSPARPRDGPD